MNIQHGIVISSSLIIVFIINVVFARDGFAVDRFDCPSPWTRLGLENTKYCYRFVFDPKLPADAAEICKIDGATLVSISNSQIHYNIQNYLNGLASRKWLTSGVKVNGKFRWANGLDVSGPYWSPLYNPKLSGNYLVYVQDEFNNWLWNSDQGNTKLPFICETDDVDNILTKSRDFGYGEKFVDSSVYEMGPIFNMQPKREIYDNSTAKYRRYVSFACQAYSNPQATYAWFILSSDNNLTPVNLRDRKNSMVNGLLMIQEPSTINALTYQCMATNKYGSILSQPVNLQLATLGKFSKSKRNEVKAVSYKGKAIKCTNAKHTYPKVIYAWYKAVSDSPTRERTFIQTDSKPYIFISDDGKLYFSMVTKSDEGDYYCWVSLPSYLGSGSGQLTKPIKMTVFESANSIQEPEIVSGFPRIFPSSPKRGDNIRIECMAWGTGDQNGKLDYSWARIIKEEGNEKEVPLPSQSVIVDLGRVLNIPSIRLIDFGTYKCTVKRMHGQSASQSVTIPVASVPYFINPIMDKIVDIKTTVNWRCITGGTQNKNNEKKHWIKNGKPLEEYLKKLPPSERIRYNLNSDNSLLIIRSVTKADQGMFQCYVSNSYGINISNGQLKVLALKPTFLKNPVQPHMYATLKSKTTIICQPESSPKAQIVWLKQGQNFQIDGQHYEQLTNGNLRINDIREDDMANYTCVAENKFGQASSHGEIAVLESTVITHLPQEMNVVNVGQNAFLRCEASYNPLLDLTYDWYQNGIKIIFYRIKSQADYVYLKQDKHYMRGFGLNIGGLHIVDAQYYHSGTYKCIAKTTSDSTQAMAQLTVKGPPSQPAGIYADQTTSYTAVIHWLEGGSNGEPITSYIVEAVHYFSSEWTRLPIEINSPQMLEEKVATVEGLHPFSEYQFRIRAVNILGEGIPSDPSTNVTTLKAPPSSPPTNLRGGGGKEGLLTILWDPIGVSQRNGKDIRYHLQFQKVGMEDQQRSKVTLNGANQHMFVENVGLLQNFTDYNVWLNVENEMGSSAVINATIKSAEAIPQGVATELGGDPFNSTALIITWTPVSNNRTSMPGILLGYRVNYWRTDVEAESDSMFRDFRGNVSQGMLIGLDIKTYYTYNIQVYNMAGYGPKSDTWLAETVRAAPMDAPVEVSLRTVSTNAVFVKWRGVSTDQDEEPLEGYKVYYWRQGENIYIAKSYDSQKRTRIVVEGLDLNTLYNLRVVGYNRGGEGLLSSPTMQFIVGDNCKATEESPEKEYVYRCSACSVQISIVLLCLATLLHLFT